MRDMVILPHVTDKVHRCNENGLVPVQQVAGNTRQGRAAIVESRQDQ